jgi:hypothetical protein
MAVMFLSMGAAQASAGFDRCHNRCDRDDFRRCNINRCDRDDFRRCDFRRCDRDDFRRCNFNRCDRDCGRWNWGYNGYWR